MHTRESVTSYYEFLLQKEQFISLSTDCTLDCNSQSRLLKRKLKRNASCIIITYCPNL